MVVPSLSGEDIWSDIVDKAAKVLEFCSTKDKAAADMLVQLNEIRGIIC